MDFQTINSTLHAVIAGIAIYYLPSMLEAVRQHLHEALFERQISSARYLGIGVARSVLQGMTTPEAVNAAKEAVETFLSHHCPLMDEHLLDPIIDDLVSTAVREIQYLTMGPQQSAATPSHS